MLSSSGNDPEGKRVAIGPKRFRKAVDSTATKIGTRAVESTISPEDEDCERLDVVLDVVANRRVKRRVELIGKEQRRT